VREALAHGVKVTGCTVLVVDEGGLIVTAITYRLD